MREERLELRLSDEERGKLQILADKNRRTKSDMIRYLIMEAYEFHKMEQEKNDTAVRRKSR